MRTPYLIILLLAGGLLLFAVPLTSIRGAGAADIPPVTVPETRDVEEPDVLPQRLFTIEVLVNGRPLAEYASRGRSYVEAIEGAEYELRVRNPLNARVAVALAVDGMNTIDARHTEAWKASKWVIAPYSTVTIRGWQMSSARARRFYFTTEPDSYGAKIGQTANLGVISAVFFREREPTGIVTPREPPIGTNRDSSTDSRRAPQPKRDRPSAGGAPAADAPAATSTSRSETAPPLDDDSAATGIGRNVQNNVRWMNLDLDPHPMAEVTIRYEYHDALVRLGILPRYPDRTDALPRRERARGFEDGRYSPEP